MVIVYWLTPTRIYDLAGWNLLKMTFLSYEISNICQSKKNSIMHPQVLITLVQQLSTDGYLFISISMYSTYTLDYAEENPRLYVISSVNISACIFTRYFL